MSRILLLLVFISIIGYNSSSAQTRITTNSGDQYLAFNIEESDDGILKFKTIDNAILKVPVTSIKERKEFYSKITAVSGNVYEVKITGFDAEKVYFKNKSEIEGEFAHSNIKRIDMDLEEIMGWSNIYDTEVKLAPKKIDKKETIVTNKNSRTIYEKGRDLLGIGLGYPNGIALILGYEREDYHLSLSAGIAEENTTGLEANIGKNLIVNRSIRARAGAIIGYMVNNGNEFFGAGPLISLDIYSIRINFGALWGHSKKYSTEGIIQIGYIYKFD